MAEGDGDPLPIALRAYAMSIASRPKRIQVDDDEEPAFRFSYSRPRHLLVFDTETRTDAAQTLTFGSWRVYERRDGFTGHAAADWELIEEGLFHADDLSEADRRILEAYRRDHWWENGVELVFFSRGEFLDRVFWPWAYKARALVVGFNLPFDLSRLAAFWTESRSRAYLGGFSLVLWTRPSSENGPPVENKFRPRIDIKTIDSKRHLIGFSGRRGADPEDLIPEGSTNGKPVKGYVFRGHFLDLRTLAFALTNQSYSLARACDDFGVEHPKFSGVEHGKITPDYIDYNRRDVLATFELACKLFEEYDRHPINLAETQAYSPASIGKKYLRAMGIRPRRELQPDFPEEILGYAMTAFYGGRAECKIRRVTVPVVYLDFLSMYPTVNANMQLWDFHTAERVEYFEDREDTQKFLDEITLEQCFDPATWREFPVLVRLQPDGEIFPVRAQYDDGAADWQIGVNPLTAEEGLWYALPDVIAAKLLSGRTPQIQRAIRFEAGGQRQDGLRPVLLRGAVAVDPEKEDFFRVVIQERKKLPLSEKTLGDFLKVLANSTSYGIFAQMDRRELPKSYPDVRVLVHGIDRPFESKTRAPEEQGEFCFPPIAACITAAARLMLAMLECCVRERGGTYAFCDTDSMAIVANEAGDAPDLITALDGTRDLSWREVEEIQHRFEQLKPYDPTAVTDPVLELEKENRDPITRKRRQLHCFAISAKRYALFHQDAEGNSVVLETMETREEQGEDSEGGGDDAITLRKPSEHGLGHLLNPKDPTGDDDDTSRREWIPEVWHLLVSEANGTAVASPEWFDRPAISRLTGSSPHVLDAFETFNTGKPYRDQVKPFNFLLSAHVADLGHPAGANPQRFHLVAPYNDNPSQWLKLRWTDIYSKRRFSITTGAAGSTSALVRVKTYANVIADYRVHPETKFDGPDGQACGRGTIGVLQRRAVHELPHLLTYIGKESNQLGSPEAEVIHDQAMLLNEYADARRDPWFTEVLPILRRMPKERLAKIAGVTSREIQRIRNGQVVPRQTVRELLSRVVGSNDS